MHGLIRQHACARRAQFEADKEAAATGEYARLIWDTALLESGFDIEAPKEFNARVYKLLGQAFKLPEDLTISPESAAAAAAEEVSGSVPKQALPCQHSALPGCCAKVTLGVLEKCTLAAPAWSGGIVVE